MPEREVSNEEFTRVEYWATTEKNGEYFNISSDAWIWQVEGEPLIVVDLMVGSDEGDRSALVLMCSEKHAKQLQEARIINFPEQQG